MCSIQHLETYLSIVLDLHMYVYRCAHTLTVSKISHFIQCPCFTNHYQNLKSTLDEVLNKWVEIGLYLKSMGLFPLILTGPAFDT